MKFHIVRNNENMEDIIFLYNLTKDELIEQNQHIRNWNKLIPGTKLRIPSISEAVEQDINDMEPFVEDYYPKLSEDKFETKEEIINENDLIDEQLIDEQYKKDNNIETSYDQIKTISKTEEKTIPVNTKNNESEQKKQPNEEISTDNNNVPPIIQYQPIYQPTVPNNYYPVYLGYNNYPRYVPVIYYPIYYQKRST